MLRLRRVASLSNWSFVLFVALYVLFNLIPASWVWFTPGPVRFLDAPVGTIPVVEYSRRIERPTYIEFTVVLRRVEPNPGSGDIVCTVTEGPFEYSAAVGPVVGKDLAWWAPNPKCYNLAEGGYWAETCWTLMDPVGDLFPALPRRVLGALTPEKHVCRLSNVFYIGSRPGQVRATY